MPHASDIAHKIIPFFRSLLRIVVNEVSPVTEGLFLRV